MFRNSKKSVYEEFYLQVGQGNALCGLILKASEFFHFKHNDVTSKNEETLKKEKLSTLGAIDKAFILYLNTVSGINFAAPLKALSEALNKVDPGSLLATNNPLAMIKAGLVGNESQNVLKTILQKIKARVAIHDKLVKLSLSDLPALISQLQKENYSGQASLEALRSLHQKLKTLDFNDCRVIFETETIVSLARDQVQGITKIYPLVNDLHQTLNEEIRQIEQQDFGKSRTDIYKEFLEKEAKGPDTAG